MKKPLFRLSLIIFTAALCLGMISAGEPAFFMLVYIYFFVFMALRTWFSSAAIYEKFNFTLIYGGILSLQIIYTLFVTFSSEPGLLKKILGILLVFVPKLAEAIFFYKRNNGVYPNEESLISYAQLRYDFDKITRHLAELSRRSKRLNSAVLRDIITEIPRHSFTKYICKGNLTEEYFEAAAAALDDENIYIIISNTGSAASEFISIFTNSTYNHASISFDRNLTTIVSYNGGEKVRPPGMNYEEVGFFNKKADSSILVYRLPASRAQKELLLDKIREINTEGSAYNLLGLALKYSYKPNIMYCSQFVYRMLKIAELDFFECREADVRPTDFIEKDYKRKLFFEYELRLNENE